MISNRRFLEEIDEELYGDAGIHDCYEKYCKYLTLDDLFTTDSVYMAACHCASGFRERNDTNAFMSHAWIKSMKLADKVRNGKFKPSYYRTKEIIERGKPRIIRPPKFECKVVQKVLCDYLLRSLLEPKMISTSYASMRGKGTDKMFSDILKALNRTGYGAMIVITDFSGYFASINTKLICKWFHERGMDEDVVKLFHSFDPEGRGLSLGNETSQIPASWFASRIDHELKDHYQYKNVFRFMDDTLVIAEDEKRAEECLKIIRKATEETDLTLKDEKIQMIPWGKQFRFCKGNFFFNREIHIYYWVMNYTVVRNEIRKIMRFKVKYEDEKMSEDMILLQVNSVLGAIKSKPNSYSAEERIKCAMANEFSFNCNTAIRGRPESI